MRGALDSGVDNDDRDGGSADVRQDARGQPAVPPLPQWVARPERSNKLALRIVVWVALKLGRKVARALLYPVCLYFVLFSPASHAASTKYLRKVLAREPGLADAIRHCHTFAATLLDRVFLFNDQYEKFDVRVHDPDEVVDFLNAGAGLFLLGAHMGSFEIVRALGRCRTHARISLVMYAENARKFNAVLSSINPALALHVIELGKLDSMLKVEAALDKGDVVGMLGDRTFEDEGTTACPFLGEPARFPNGPFRLAAMLKRPVVLMFGLYRGGNRYDIHFERFVDSWPTARGERSLLVDQAMRRYAERLEYYCRIAPYNWYNFYDFWK
ncbi:MAG: acyl-CoA synthetase [Burkholderiales bacterium]